MLRIKINIGVPGRMNHYIIDFEYPRSLLMVLYFYNLACISCQSELCTLPCILCMSIFPFPDLYFYWTLLNWLPKMQVDVKRSMEEGEKRFNKLSIEERGKFDEETLVNVNSIKKQSSTVLRAGGFSNEYIVVRTPILFFSLGYFYSDLQSN